MGIRSAPQLLDVWMDGALDMNRVPGEDVDQSPDYMRYEPRRCNIFPANLQTIGFQMVETAVVAQLIKFAKEGRIRVNYCYVVGTRVHEYAPLANVEARG